MNSQKKKDREKATVRFATAGSVDDGKSTLIGRLLFDSNSVFADHLSAITRNNNPLDLSLLTDGLKAEREQKITIDVAYRYFTTSKRHFILADCPGHEQYTKNMVSGISTAHILIILLDAKRGITNQTRRHLFIANMFDIRHIIVAVNKMDLVDYAENIFTNLKKELLVFAQKIGLGNLIFLPVSALNGDNIVHPSENMPWHKGPSILNLLEDINIEGTCYNLIDFRLPIQNIIYHHQEFRGIAGQIVSGIVRQRDRIIAIPSMKKSVIKSIFCGANSLQYAFAPQSITLLLEDNLDISRGDMLVPVHNIPHIENCFEAMIVWLDERNLTVNHDYYLKTNNKTVLAQVKHQYYQIDMNSFSRNTERILHENDIGRVYIETNSPTFFDSYAKNHSTGMFILIDAVTNNTVAAGVIIDRKSSEHLPIKSKMTLWLTGLSGAGKTTIARQLGERIPHCFILDGDSLREGLNKDLGFSLEDRQENIRRVAEVAKILNAAGVVAIVALISPLENDRQMARQIVGENSFCEIFVDASLDTCITRDPKGLYKDAQLGTIKDFTGISSPYQAPTRPDIHLQTDTMTVDQCVNKIMREIKRSN